MPCCLRCGKSSLDVEHLHPALALAKSLGRNDGLAPIFWRLTNNALTEGRVTESLGWAEEMLDIAQATGDADLRVTAHARACTCCCWAGEFTKAREHADKVRDLYDTEKHRRIADIINRDPKTSTGIHARSAPGYWASRTGPCG